MVQPIRSIEKCDSDDKKNIEPEHLRTYRRIWNVINTLGAIVGVSAHKDLGWQPIIGVCIFVVCVGYSFMFYTICLVWRDPSNLIEITCIFGILLPVCVMPIYRLFCHQMHKLS